VEDMVQETFLHWQQTTCDTLNDVEFGKPEPDLFLLAAEHMGCAL
jgi:beta-phosphoglucomutase-like phosphatase (HAD superfamily)